MRAVVADLLAGPRTGSETAAAAGKASAAKAPPLVAIRNVAKRFPARLGRGRIAAVQALRSVNCEIGAGELVSFLGPSGCGKTTLLKMLAGLVRSDEGEIVVADKPVHAPRRDLCMVFQNFGLLPWRTVEANVEFPLQLDGVGAAERRARARPLIEMVGLGGFERHFPHELSGGMQQRVGLARALIRKPLVILMDEPFAALDAQTREVLQEDFIAICRTVDTTVVLVTHSIEEALVMSNRIMVFTPRPGTIERVIEEPLGAERQSPGVRGTPAFAQWRQAIHDILRSGNDGNRDPRGSR
jgi:NitT/TauT family transport system ATP-binding protein